MTSQPNSASKPQRRYGYLALTWTTVVVGLILVVIMVGRGMGEVGKKNEAAMGDSPTLPVPTATAGVVQVVSIPTSTATIPNGWVIAANGRCDSYPISVSMSSAGNYYWPSSNQNPGLVVGYCTSSEYLNSIPVSSSNFYDPSGTCGWYPDECVSSSGGPCDTLEGGCIPYHAADISLRCNTSFECVGPPNMNQDPWASNQGQSNSGLFADTPLGRPIYDDPYGQPSNDGPWWQNDSSCVPGYSPSYQC
jgi:hypothetical protein